LGSLLHGVAETRAALERVRFEIEAASGPAVGAAGTVVAREMASRAPRDTGRLAASIDVDVQTVGEGATAKVGAQVPYDRFVQFGTVYMMAQPYGRDASEDSTSGVVAAMASVYKAAIE
jgi:HK97 gp10 family phage protein